MQRMKRKNVLIIVVAWLAVFAGSAAAQNQGASDAVETTASGAINWTVGEVSATGIGAPPAYAANAAQARAMAERAAFIVALRNLLETVKGVRVDSNTVVENFMTTSDVIKTRVEGLVRGARIMKTQYLSDGSVEVVVTMPMKGAFLNAVVPDSFGSLVITPAPVRPAPVPQKPADIRPEPPGPEKKTEPGRPAPPPAKVPEIRPEPSKPAPPASTDSTVDFKGGVATGLVIDGRGLGLKPALLPRIVDQQGAELYVGQVVTRTNAVEQGVAGYARDVNAAANNFRVTDNPVVIKGIGASGAARTDVVIGQADAQALRRLSGKGEFLQYCRVIIVY